MLQQQPNVFTLWFLTALLLACLLTPAPALEQVKVPLCANKYPYTTFPNLFNHASQTEAIQHLHTFQPLGAFCADQLPQFLCLVHFPAYDSIKSTVPNKPCRSYCETVTTQCQYAMSRLNIAWPNELACHRFPGGDCVTEPGPSKPTPPTGCVGAFRLPMCSTFTSDGRNQFFAFVNGTSFTNYFKHNSQAMAVYELSRHGRLINLLVALKNDQSNTNVADCLRDLRYLLCSLHLPHCQQSSYLITKPECEATLGTKCTSAVALLRKKGYVITWPPVSVNCGDFKERLSGSEIEMASYIYQENDLAGLSPPPPGVSTKINGYDFAEVGWKPFPIEFSRNLEVQTEVLYKQLSPSLDNHYTHAGHYNPTKTSTFIDSLAPKATYEILIGTVNNATLLSGTFTEATVVTGSRIFHKHALFCSELQFFVSGPYPNAFGDMDQLQGQKRMRTFHPLFDTSCSAQLRAFMCSAFVPRYNPSSGTAEKPCRSFCETVRARCSYAITQLKFKWPAELECAKLTNTAPCYQPPVVLEAPKRLPCSQLVEQSFCSLVLKRFQSSRLYFGDARNPFWNHFNHKSQEQAVFELNKHARLLQLMDAYRRSETRRSSIQQATTCIGELVFTLCSLYLPPCSPSYEYSLTRFSCENILNVAGSCTSSVQALKNRKYTIYWPPVPLDICTQLLADEVGPSYTFGEIKFGAGPTYPAPPAVLSYQTNATDVTIHVDSSEAPGFKGGKHILLYKPLNSEVTYSQYTDASDLLTIKGIASENVEIFVGRLDTLYFTPGYLDKIVYVADTKVYDIPSSLDLCQRFYPKTILPNRLGDTTVEQASKRIASFFPLVYTLCSDEITPFLCSALVPRFHPRYSPCRSTCERVYKSCLYAIKRTKFHWPAELSCEKFDEGNTCYDTTEIFLPDGKVPLPFSLPLGEPQKRAAEATCKEIKPNLLCSRVRVVNDPSPYFVKVVDFEAGQTNYFKHASMDVAVFELSRHLPLMSILYSDNIEFNSTQCAEQLTLLLCHLHLPVCPDTTQTVNSSYCRQILAPTSSCYYAITRLQQKYPQLRWPPVNVDCSDANWFGKSNKTFQYQPGGLLQPPPENLKVSSRSSTQFSITFGKSTSQEGPQVNSAAILYRQLDADTAYTVINSPVIHKFPYQFSTLFGLEPSTSYEILVGLSYQVNGLPGLFGSITNKTYGRCPNDTTGDAATQGVFVWSSTNSGRIASTKCPHGSSIPGSEFGDYEGFNSRPQRLCNCNDMSCIWNDPRNIRYCNYASFNDTHTQELSNLLQEIVRNPDAAVNVSESLVDLTTNQSGVAVDDVVLTVEILENLVDTRYLNETGSNIIKVIDALLDTNDAILLDGEQRARTSTRTLVLLEKYLESVPLLPGGSFEQNEPNIAVSTREFNGTNFLGAAAASLNYEQEIKDADEDFVVYGNDNSVQPSSSQVSLTLPKSLFESLGIDSKKQNQRVSFVIYRRTSLFQTGNKTAQTEAGTVRMKNSYVISGSVKGHAVEHLTNPVVSTYIPLRKAINMDTACVFWKFDTNNNGPGGWSKVGCTYIGIDDNVVTCHCDHLTNFAILMDVIIDDGISEAHSKALSYISYIGCAISLLGLVLTIITVLVFRDLRRKVPSQILLSFCIALALTLIVFLAAAERDKTSSMRGCRAAAIALHYFVLATFVWMALSAFNMYQAFVKIIPKHRSRFFLKCSIVGWGLPAIVVIITAAVAIEEYGDDNFCRVKGLPFQVTFLAPVLLILVGNSIAFALILHSLLTSRRNITADRKVSGLTQARRGAAILVVLGLTWVFGIFAVKDAKLVFQYLFCIFNALQGFFVFLFYCVLSNDTRGKYKRLLCGKDKAASSSETGQKVRGSSGENVSRGGGVNTKSTGDSALATSSSTGRPSSGTQFNLDPIHVRIEPR